MDIYVFINNERKSLRQLSAESGVAYETIYARWKNGVPADKLAELPKPEEPELPPTKEEVVNALGYTPGMVNPNLLDNWYFGNPVDQRGGYVVPPGVNYYVAGVANPSGVTERYYTARMTSEGAYIDINGVSYVCFVSDAVRGYTETGYTIDRWTINSCTHLSLTGSGVNFRHIENPATTEFYADFTQNIKNYDAIKGKTVTFSVLTNKGFFSSSCFLSRCRCDNRILCCF
jgi:hypothetical protein